MPSGTDNRTNKQKTEQDAKATTTATSKTKPATKQASKHSLRHRRNANGSLSTTRDSIITTAYDLFREKGYAKASLSELARRIGMDPSSLYYYFPSKEALLAEIFNPETDIPSLEDLSFYTTSRTEQLYALIMQDVVQKCEMPLDFIDMESAARSKPKAFAKFYERYKEFYHTLVKVIECGIEEKEFRPCEADERAVTILSINEGLQHHFHAKERGELLLAESGYTAHDHSPEDIGHLSALSVIPALITEDINFDEAAHRGRRLYSLIVKRKQRFSK